MKMKTAKKRTQIKDKVNSHEPAVAIGWSLWPVHQWFRKRLDDPQPQQRSRPWASLADQSF